MVVYCCGMVCEIFGLYGFGIGKKKGREGSDERGLFFKGWEMKDGSKVWEKDLSIMLDEIWKIMKRFVRDVLGIWRKLIVKKVFVYFCVLYVVDRLEVL